MTEISKGHLNGLSNEFKNKFTDFRLVVVRLPLNLIKAISIKSRFEEMTVQQWIVHALEKELELESVEDLFGLDSFRFEVDEDDLDA